MKIYLECLPCMLRQVLEAAQMTNDDSVIQQSIMDKAIDTLSKYRCFSCAPMLCEAMHKIVKEHTGVEDPYAEIKAQDISQALRLEPLIRSFSLRDKELLFNALKVSATGNIMDSALYTNLNIEACLQEELEKPFGICDYGYFLEDISKAKQILIIGDNAGEVVFDKILAEYLAKKHQVIYAVRDVAIINDATLEDALKTGIIDYAKVVSTGCSMPGAVLEACSLEFTELFNNADVVISKGQGNFEALSDTTRNVYFLLKAKCQRIAEEIGTELNDYVFKQKNGKS